MQDLAQDGFKGRLPEKLERHKKEEINIECVKNIIEEKRERQGEIGRDRENRERERERDLSKNNIFISPTYFGSR